MTLVVTEAVLLVRLGSVALEATLAVLVMLAVSTFIEERKFAGMNAVITRLVLPPLTTVPRLQVNTVVPVQTLGNAADEIHACRQWIGDDGIVRIGRSQHYSHRWCK